jgi:hypothetical protein
LEFRTSSYRNGLIGLALSAGLLAGTGVLIDQLARLPFTLPAFGVAVAILVLLAGLGVLVYWTLAALRLVYRLDRNGVRIRWGASQLVVPIRNIQSIMPVSQAPRELALDDVFRGRAWLGGWAASATLSDGRQAVLYSHDDPRKGTAVLTDTHVYVVSPDRPGAFIEGWQDRRSLGPTQEWCEEKHLSRWLALPIWSDHVTWGLMGGLLMTALIVFATLALVYHRLPERLPLHFDVFGQPDRIGQRSEVLRLPVVAFLMLVIDLGLGFVVYRRDRVAAYLIWAGAILLQMLAWGALYTIATR